MKTWIAMTIALLCAALIGACLLASMTYIHIGQGLHPVVAGVISLGALLVGLWSSGEVEA